MAVNIKSNQIKVYPTSKRSDIHDRNARLSSEQNLTSMVNRLTRRNCFVIDKGTLKLEARNDGKNYLTLGKCNIFGYYFHITEDIELNTLPNNGQYVYLKIITKQSTVQDVGTRTQVTFEELQGNDSNSTATSIYNGLVIDYNSNGDLAETVPGVSSDEIIHYFKLGQYLNGEWINNELKYLIHNASDQYIRVNQNTTTDNVDTILEKSLQEFFDENLKNLIIDDGDLLDNV